MSNYTQNVFFTPKDSLITGDANKKIKGSELDAELAEISSTIGTKEDTANRGAASGYAPLDGGTKVATTYLPTATEAAIGAVELATTAEAAAGADTSRAVTPAGVGAALGAFTAAPALFTGNLVEVRGSSPALYFNDTDAPTNERLWRALAESGNFYLTTLTDAGGAGDYPITITRTGTAVDVVAIVGASMTFNGSSITAANSLTSGTLPDARIASTGVTQHQAALSIAETQIPDGSILARIGANETISGTWTFTNLTMNGTVSGNTTFSGSITMSSTLGVTSNATVGGTLGVTGVATLSNNVTVGGTLGVTGNTTLTGTLTKSGAGKYPYFGSATQSSGIITIGTAAVSGTPAAGDIYIQHSA